MSLDQVIVKPDKRTQISQVLKQQQPAGQKELTNIIQVFGMIQQLQEQSIKNKNNEKSLKGFFFFFTVGEDEIRISQPEVKSCEQAVAGVSVVFQTHNFKMTF